MQLELKVSFDPQGRPVVRWAALPACPCSSRPSGGYSSKPFSSERGVLPCGRFAILTSFCLPPLLHDLCPCASDDLGHFTFMLTCVVALAQFCSRCLVWEACKPLAALALYLFSERSHLKMRNCDRTFKFFFFLHKILDSHVYIALSIV